MAELNRELIGRPGSPILNQFKAGRERARREQLAQRELQQAMSAMRGSAIRHAAQRVAQPAGPQPAFPSVSGQRAFSAAANDRMMTGWVSYSTGINVDLDGALDPMRARSRDWAVNTDMGRRYVQLVKDNIIGASAPRLQVRAMMAPGSSQLDELGNNTIEAHWAAWCAGPCDVTGRLSFAQLCRTLVACAARDGEYLVRRVRHSSLPYGYALQMMDVDRMLTGNGGAAQAEGANHVRLGVEVDQIGRVQAYHLHSMHPSDSGSGKAPAAYANRVPADGMFHGYVLERPEQLRGYPWTAAILKRANTLDTYEQYAVQAAKIGAAKMGFYTIDKDAPVTEMTVEDFKDATGNLVQDVEAGMLEALPPGVNFESFNPDYPHQNFDSFVTTCVRGIAAGLNVAHHNLSGDMTGVNYSSARIAELSERQHWMGLQQWFIDGFVVPVFREWLGLALASGAITLPASGKSMPGDTLPKWVAAASFQPRRWGWVDPRADMDASVTSLENHLRSHRQIADEQGVDLDDVLSDESRYREQVALLGLQPAAGKPVAPQQPNTTTTP